jgi:hypothetical protein
VPVDPEPDSLGPQADLVVDPAPGVGEGAAHVDPSLSHVVKGWGQHDVANR